MKDLFIEFLKKNNAYDAFIRNLYIQNDGIDFDTFFKEEDFANFLDTIICDAFTWSETNKYEDPDASHLYWSELNDKWENIFNQQQNEKKQ